MRPVTASAAMLSLLTAAILASTEADTIDLSICASDTRVVYNASGVDLLAEAFFSQIAVDVQETIVGPSGSGPGYNRTIVLGGVPLAGFNSAVYEFRSGCEIVRAGWCGNVTFSATWLTPSRAKVNLAFSTAMCIPLSCCNTSACLLDYGVSQYASTILTDMVYSWCAPVPVNQTSQNCPISLDSTKMSINGKPRSAAGLLGDAGKRVAFWLANPDERLAMTLPPQPPARRAFQQSSFVLDDESKLSQVPGSLRSGEPAAPAAVSRGLLGQLGSGDMPERLPSDLSSCSGGLTSGLSLANALGSNTSGLEISVTTVCVAGGLDIFTYLLVSLSIVMLLCMGIACGQRYYYARRARRGLDDVPGMFFAGAYDEEEEDPQVRLARVAQRQQALRSLAFPMGSKTLQAATSSKSATDALTTMGGTSGARKDSMGSSVAKGNPDAATSLLAGAGDADSGASSSSMMDSLTDKPGEEGLSPGTSAEGPGPTVVVMGGTDEEHVDPITLDTIQEGEQVLEFPGCHHLFRLESITQWFETNETCPVCRRQFSAPSSAAATGDDAKVASA